MRSPTLLETRSDLYVQLATLLVQLDIAFGRSEIKKYAERNRQQWYYSLVTGRIQRNQPLLVGFNWGAANQITYERQSTIIPSSLVDEDLGSLRRIIPYCINYIAPRFLECASQTNLCFFRSRNEKEISAIDIELCKPIFNSLIEVLEPSQMLCFSSTLRNYLVTSGLLNDLLSETIAYRVGAQKRSYRVVKGTVCNGVKIAFLPHPNSRLTKRGRDRAWEFCFSKARAV